MMDEEPQRQIEELEKYIPFIDYLLDLDRENPQHQKLELIKQWIIGKQRLDKIDVMEQSILTQYKNQNMKMPKEILQIFGKTEKPISVKYTTVNLCSDDESDDDVICISSTIDPENSKPKTQNTTFLSNIKIKVEAPCASTQIVVTDNKSAKKQKDTEKSAENQKKDDISAVCVTSSTDVFEIMENEAQNVNHTDGKNVDSASKNAIHENPEKIISHQFVLGDCEIFSKLVNDVVEKAVQRLLPNLSSFPKTAEITDKMPKDTTEKNKSIKLRNKNPVIVINESPNKKSEVSSTSTITIDDDDDGNDDGNDNDEIAELYARMDKVDNLTDKSNDDTDNESFYSYNADLDSSTTPANNENNKSKNIPTNEVEIKKEQLFTRRIKNSETSCTVDSQYNVDIDPEIYTISDTEDMENVEKEEHSAATTTETVKNVSENELETMDINELHEVLEQLARNNNLDTEQLIQLIVQTQIENNAQDTAPRNRNVHDNGNNVSQNFSSKNSIIASPANSTTQESLIPPPPSNCSFNESLRPSSSNFGVTVGSFLPKPLPNCMPNQPAMMINSKIQIQQTPSAQLLPIVQQISYQNHVPPPPPQPPNAIYLYDNNGRKYNLNDPRLWRRIQIMKNSLITSSVREMPTSSTTYTPPTQMKHQPHTKPASQDEDTCDEYRRKNAEIEKEVQEKRAAERVANEKRIAERLAEQKRAAYREAEEKRTAERLAKEKRAAERLAEEKRAADRKAEEKRTAERLAKAKRTAERLVEQKRATEREVAEKRAAELVAKKKRIAERLAEQKRTAESVAKEKRAALREAEEKRTAERLAKEKRAAESLVEQKRADERLAEEKRAVDREAEEKRTAERLIKAKRMIEQKCAAERLTKERHATEREVEEKRAAERITKEKRTAERLSKEKHAAVRLVDQKRVDERLFEEKRAAERKAEEKCAAERLAKEKCAVDREAEEKRAAERLSKEKSAAEHLIRQKRTAERLAKEKHAAELKVEKKRAAEREAEEKRAAERLSKEKRAAEREVEEKRVAELEAEEKCATERLAKAKRLAEKKRVDKRIAEEKQRTAKCSSKAKRLAEEKRTTDHLSEEKLAAERVAQRLAEKKRADKHAAKKVWADACSAEEKHLAEQNQTVDRAVEEKKAAESAVEEKRAEAKYLAKTKQTLERLAKEKRTAERVDNEKRAAERSAAEKQPAERLDRQNLAAKRLADEKRAAERLTEKKGEKTTAAKLLAKSDLRLTLKKNNQPKQSTDEFPKTSRELKSILECSLIEFKDSTTLNGKRQSSECARNAIFWQLNNSSCYHNLDDMQEVRASEPPKRRSSFTTEKNKEEPTLTAAPIKRRRRTCVEFDKTSLGAVAPILNHHKTCATSGLGVARSSSPIVDDDLICLSDSSEPMLENMTQEITVIDILSSSSDTDTFDLEEFKREKERKEQKKRIANNQPFVRLLRHTPEEIEKLLNHTEPEVTDNLPPALSDEVLNVQLVPAVCEPESSINESTKPTTNHIKNVLSAMTERNTRYCVLCRSRPSDLVNHYVRSHKCEPYVARLTEEELQDLQINWPTAIPYNTTVENARFFKYKVTCPFCDDKLIDSFINFHNHFATHTGEYGFQCENCKLQKPFRADIQSHKHHSKTCRNARIQTVYVYPANLMTIYLHCCKLCNFVQLNEANVHKHLREHHDQPTGDNSTLVEKYIAAAINETEIVNEACQESELLEDEEMHEIPTQLQNTTEYKEEIILEEVASLGAYEQKISSRIIHNADNINDAEIPRPIIIKTEFAEMLNVPEDETRTFFSHKLQRQLSKRNIPPLWYRLYTPNESYFGLLKCMASDCMYSTNESLEMLTHLNDHSTSECPPTGYLDCSYCMLQPNQCPTAETLIKHIMDRHYNSCFQCSKCGYRSCIPGNVLLHKRTAHFDDDDDAMDDDEFVYACEGPTAVTVNERLADMLHSMEQNVSKLQCQYCPQGFYAVSNLRKHLMQRHEVVAEDFDEYVCIYCGIKAADKKEMQLHLAMKHPDELAHTCLRLLQDSQKEDTVSNLILCDIKEDVLPTKICQTGAQASEILATDTNVLLNNLDGAVQIPSSAEEPQDLKPSIEQLEQIAVDSLGSLLNKLTLKTGLPPDILYQCAEKTCGGIFANHELWSRHMKLRHNCYLARCPHCPDKKELAVTDFSQHFKEHCRHLYVCFHCGMTFINDAGVVVHFQLEHSTMGNATETTRFETIKFNIRYSYYIMINAQFNSERLEFLEALRVNIIKRIGQLNNEEKSTLSNKWIVPLTAEWLDNFPIYKTTHNCSKRCLDKDCTFKTACDNELVTHLRTRHSVNSRSFQCSKCSFYINKCQNWDQVLDHFSMHKSNLFACCVCGFYHFQRANLMAHIKTEHKSRDVPFISLDRSVEGTRVTIGVVFVAGRKILSTISECFFCTSADIFNKTYIKHLKNVHNVHLRYQCELCLTALEHLVDVDEHFNSTHMGLQKSISCEFISAGQVEISEIRPLKLNVGNSKLTATTAKRGFDKDDTVYYTNNKRLRVPSPKLGDIKKELPEDEDGNNTDSSVEIIDDDDIAFAAEVNSLRNESNVTSAPKIKLKSFSALSSNVAASYPRAQNQCASELLPNNGLTSSQPVELNVAVACSGNQTGTQFQNLIAPPSTQQSNMDSSSPNNGLNFSQPVQSNFAEAFSENQTQDYNEFSSNNDSLAIPDMQQQSNIRASLLGAQTQYVPSSLPCNGPNSPQPVHSNFAVACSGIQTQDYNEFSSNNGSLALPPMQQQQLNIGASPLGAQTRYVPSSLPYNGPNSSVPAQSNFAVACSGNQTQDYNEHSSNNGALALPDMQQQQQSNIRASPLGTQTQYVPSSLPYNGRNSSIPVQSNFAVAYSGNQTQDYNELSSNNGSLALPDMQQQSNIRASPLGTQTQYVPSSLPYNGPNSSIPVQSNFAVACSGYQTQDYNEYSSNNGSLALPDMQQQQSSIRTSPLRAQTQYAPSSLPYNGTRSSPPVQSNFAGTSPGTQFQILPDNSSLAAPYVQHTNIAASPLGAQIPYGSEFSPPVQSNVGVESSRNQFQNFSEFLPENGPVAPTSTIQQSQIQYASSPPIESNITPASCGMQFQNFHDFDFLPENGPFTSPLGAQTQCAIESLPHTYNGVPHAPTNRIKLNLSESTRSKLFQSSLKAKAAAAATTKTPTKRTSVITATPSKTPFPSKRFRSTAPKNVRNSPNHIISTKAQHHQPGMPSPPNSPYDSYYFQYPNGLTISSMPADTELSNRNWIPPQQPQHLPQMSSSNKCNDLNCPQLQKLLTAQRFPAEMEMCNRTWEPTPHRNNN